MRVNLRHSNEDVDAARQGSDVCAPALGQVDSKYCRLRRQATDEDNDCGAVDNVSISSVSCRESSRGSPIHGCAHGEAVLTAALKQANASRHLRACSTRAAGYEGSSHSHACPGSWAGMEREWHDYQHQHAGPSLYPTEISPTSVVSPSASGRLFNIQAWEGELHEQFTHLQVRTLHVAACHMHHLHARQTAQVCRLSVSFGWHGTRTCHA